MSLKRVEADDLPVRPAGGDTEVPRDYRGSPRIVVTCTKCNGVGKMVSEKTGKPIKCTGACGPKAGDEATATLKPGQRLRSYTRTTTYIDCIEDKSNLMAWKGRMTLVGVAQDPTLIKRVLEHWDTMQDPKAEEEEVKKAKDWLTRRAETAQDKAGASDKADRGNYLHGLSELVDQGIALPDDVNFEASIDMWAYRKATFDLVDIVHMERLMVLDEFQVGGTPDRVSTIKPGVTLVAPDGHVFSPDERIITDLKTGTTEYGQLKMAMQLSIYANSLLYDWKTGKRSQIENLNREWGVIMNVPANSGECELLWADLSMGWRAVRIAREIRQLRNEGKRALIPLEEVNAGVAA